MEQSVFFVSLLLLGTCSAFENVALRGKATQSRRYRDYSSAAYNAIDGNRESIYSYGSCSSTASQTNPWWRVDLLDTYVILYVIITNRGDSGAANDGAEIYIGNSLREDGAANTLVGVIKEIPTGRSHPFKFPPVKGRYVTVYLPGSSKSLVLCEVEVYGYRLGEIHNHTKGENLVLPDATEEPYEQGK